MIRWLRGERLPDFVEGELERWRHRHADRQTQREDACPNQREVALKNQNTPIVVERIVTDIDEIVRQVRFPGWQQTSAGERDVQRALRRTLLKYKLHRDQELFEKAYGYIRQYY